MFVTNRLFKISLTSPARCLYTLCKNTPEKFFMKNKLGKHDYILWSIRLLLMISIVVNITLMITGSSPHEHASRQEILEAFSKKIELIFWTLVTLMLSFLPDYIEKRRHIHLPHLLEIIIVVFIFAGIFLSVRFDLYYQVFWWDDLLHILSGVIIGFIGFIIIYKINGRYCMNISPLLVAVFAFSFAVTMGVIWEIFEFAMDALLGTTMQSWDLPETTFMMGKPFQGSGLRDTMSDLIVNSIGALFTSVICYFLYKKDKKKTLAMMHEIFPDE
jgi:drug/metabolite transporter (DMT)-like permease